MKYEETSKRLKLALEIKGIKAQELAERSGVNKASISQYINGIHIPNNISAAKIGDVLNVNPVWLMGLSDKMHESDIDFSKINPDILAEITKNPELYTIIEKYVSLSDDDKKIINSMIIKLAEP